jgi:beta-galactosidase
MTPLAWLSQRRPEILMLDATDRRLRHGSRQHARWSVETYRRHVARVASELA